MQQHAQTRGVWGYALPGNLRPLRLLLVASEAIYVKEKLYILHNGYYYNIWQGRGKANQGCDILECLPPVSIPGFEGGGLECSSLINQTKVIDNVPSDRIVIECK